MQTVRADYRERKRVVFEARGRHFTNVREAAADDGPVGYTSVELLMIAVGNCTLGSLLDHELLRDAEVTRAAAELTAEMAMNPTRVDHIDVAIDLEVTDPALLAHHEAIEVASCACPLCNTLGDKVRTTVRLTCPAATH